MEAFIYSRISRAARTDEGEVTDLGVQRQEELCRALADRNGYAVVQVFRENDTGASSLSRKPRPQYDDMMRRARDGEAQLILAYSNSRLTRRPKEWEDLIQLYEVHHVRVETVVSGRYNLGTADGRLQARLLASVDAAEAERLSERLKAQQLQARGMGRAHWALRPYGWNMDRTVNEAEAGVLRWAAGRVAQGSTVNAVAAELNARGVPTSKGNRWTPTVLRATLTHERNIGKLTYQPHGGGREVIGDGDWPAILTPELFHATVAAVNARKAKPLKAGRAPKQLLSGIATCAVCGAGVTSVWRGTAARRFRGYQCGAPAHHASCRADYAEGLVFRALLRELPRNAQAWRPQPDTQPADVAGLALQRDALLGRKAELGEAFGAGLVDMAQLTAASRIIDQQLAELDAQMMAAAPVDKYGDALLDVEYVAAEWEALPLEVQRATVGAAFASVVVHPWDRVAVPCSRDWVGRLTITPR